MLVTTVTQNRVTLFKNPAHAREAIETLYRVQIHYPFFLYGFVIMPDHCHFLMYVPAPGTVSKVMNVYKSGLTFNLGIKKLWQPRFHIRNIDSRLEALAYIHSNPIRASLSVTTEEYPWSSATGKWDVSPLDMP